MTSHMMRRAAQYNPRSPANYSMPGHPFHTASLTWRSGNAQTLEEWHRIENNLKRRRLGRLHENNDSGNLPKTYQEYVAHKNDWKKVVAEETTSRLKNQNEELKSNKRLGRQPFDPQSAVIYDDGFSTVLGLPTIWTPYVIPIEDHPDAPWPSIEELREEGDERHTSGFIRFLPVPRVPGNPTVNWKQKHFRTPHELDEVDPVAFRFEVYEGLNCTQQGIPIDDEDQCGRTVYVHSNDFQEWIYRNDFSFQEPWLSTMVDELAGERGYSNAPSDTISMGYAGGPPAFDTIDLLIQQADRFHRPNGKIFDLRTLDPTEFSFNPNVADFKPSIPSTPARGDSPDPMVVQTNEVRHWEELSSGLSQEIGQGISLRALPRGSPDSDDIDTRTPPSVEEEQRSILSTAKTGNCLDACQYGAKEKI